MFWCIARSPHRATKPSQRSLRIVGSKPRLYFIPYLLTCTKVTAHTTIDATGCGQVCPSRFASESVRVSRRKRVECPLRRPEQRRKRRQRKHAARRSPCGGGASCARCTAREIPSSCADTSPCRISKPCERTWLGINTGLITSFPIG